MAEKQQIERIIWKMFRVPVSWRDWDRAHTLPLNLRTGYEFAQMRFRGEESLLMIDRSPGMRSPGRIARELQGVQRRFRKEVVYVSSHITHYQRQRLIAQDVPFIVPGRQLFLPDRAINLHERNPRPLKNPDTFMPITQVVLLHLLYGRSGSNERTPAELANSLEYSRMSMTRALNQLEATAIIGTKLAGRRREIELTLSRREMWEKALPYLRSPYLRSRWILMDGDDMHFGLQGGLFALAYYSNLAEPRQKTLVISEHGWQKRIESFEVREEPQEEAEWVEVQVWSYNPSLFTTNGVVDPLSLFLSLRDTRDERVEEALEDMMEGVRW